MALSFLPQKLYDCTFIACANFELFFVNGSLIPVVEEAKFLGVTIDKKTPISPQLALLEK